MFVGGSECQRSHAREGNPERGPLPDGHGELPGGALALPDQEGPTFPLPEPAFCHTAGYSPGEPAGRGGRGKDEVPANLYPITWNNRHQIKINEETRR